MFESFVLHIWIGNGKARGSKRNGYKYFTILIWNVTVSCEAD